MVRYLLRRLVLGVITLWLLATIVFAITNILPTDVGRTILGPFAPPETVAALNERLGTNRPIAVRYVESITGLVSLNFGDSFVNGSAVLPQVLGAVGRSAKLAALALLITIPFSIAAGLYAARRRDRIADRGIVLAGVTLSSIPEFVTGTILVVVIGVQFKLLPVLATAPENADPATQIRYLLLPAIAMAIVYFGYIARMTRAGAIEVLQSDYIRTATMKGLTTGQTMRRHVLRNALVPTVAVIGVQIGYLFGGIIAVEKIFNYNGMGATMLYAAQRKDLPMLTAGVLVIGVVYMVATLVADLIIAWMNPRIRLEADR
jgi:peptide/nickel transport system permease protein